MDRLPARTGWTWLKQGVGLFRQQPGALTTLLFTGFLTGILIGWVPLLGQIAMSLLFPFFSLALMRACQMIEDGERVTPAVLLTGFRTQALPSLGKIGVIYLVVFTALGIMAVLATPDALRHLPIGTQPQPGQKLPFSGTDVLVGFALSMLEIVLLLTLCFAAPLAYWKRMGAGKATFYSFFAVVRAARVFAVLLLCWLGMCMGVFSATVLVFGMLFNHMAVVLAAALWVMFLFMLVLQCALYVGYRDIFGRPPQAAPA